MTFTEAAVEVLKSVQKPLHYKKITELAIEKNLLSHVGKTPEVTMSSRLATMVKKDRGEAPIVKIKPGVFALRDVSSDSVSDDDDTSSSAEEEISPNVENVEEQENNPHVAPGSDLFPEEEDDDEPILAKLDQEEKDRRNRRKRRSRKRGSESREDSSSSSEESTSSPERNYSERSNSERRRFESRRSKERNHARANNMTDNELKNMDLIDAIETVLESGRRKPLSVLGLTELLIHRGRLEGDPSMLIPTVVSSIRGQVSRSNAREELPKIWIKNQMVGLRSWMLSSEQQRAEKELQQSIRRWKEASNRAFLRRVTELPTSAWMELIAAWLNAEGVTKLRGIRRDGSHTDAFHLCGEIKGRWGETQKLAIVIYPHGKSVGREEVVEIRGALHHYGNADMAWLLTTRQILSGALEEASGADASPVILFDGFRLAQSMAKCGVAHRQAPVHLAWIDEEFLDQLTGNDKADSSSRNSNSTKSDRSRSRRERENTRRENRRSSRASRREDEQDSEENENSQLDQNDQKNDVDDDFDNEHHSAEETFRSRAEKEEIAASTLEAESDVDTTDESDLNSGETSESLPVDVVEVLEESEEDKK